MSKVYNRKPDPRLVTAIPGGWNSTRERVDGLVRVTPNPQAGTPFVRGTIYPAAEATAGMVTTVTVTNTDGQFEAGNYLQAASESSREYVAVSDTVRTYWLHALNGGNPALWVHTYPVSILGVGIHTIDDWDAIRRLYEEGRLPLPWFAGDTLPSGGGASF